MRLLVDENLSPILAELFRAAGHDALHVNDLGLAAVDDATILRHASEQDRVVVSADTDFGTLLAASGDTRPSVLLVRVRTRRPAAQLAPVVLANLPALEGDLAAALSPSSRTSGSAFDGCRCDGPSRDLLDGCCLLPSRAVW